MQQTQFQAGARSLLSTLKADLPAGAVVFLVALPLCLGIALASGVPLLAGLVSGILGGLVVAWLSGSRTSVSGPAAGLVVIVIDAIATLGSFQAFLAATVLAGALQCLFGTLRLGRLAALVPSSVIKGMLAAIGITLIIKQLPVALGYVSAAHAMHLLPDGLSDPQTWRAALSTVTLDAVVVTAVSLALLWGWESPRVRRVPFLGALPAPLVAVAFGVGYHALSLALDPSSAFASFQRVKLPEIDGLASLLTQLPSPDWSVLSQPQVYAVAASLALVASLETLLCVEAADKLDPARQRSLPNRELLAQGVGNMAAGLLGGLPITAVIVRTSANIQAGARSRLSAVVHGALLLLSLLSLSQWLAWLPLAALAAILLHTGAKLAKPTELIKAFRQGGSAGVPFAVTLVAILCTDLLVGIAVGLVSSMAFLLHAQARGALAFTSHRGAHLLRFNKDIGFFNKPQLQRCLDQVQPGESLVIDGLRGHYVDPDIADMLREFEQQARTRSIELEWHMRPQAAPAPAPGWRAARQS